MTGISPHEDPRSGNAGTQVEQASFPDFLYTRFDIPYDPGRNTGDIRNADKKRLFFIELHGRIPPCLSIYPFPDDGWYDIPCALHQFRVIGCPRARHNNQFASGFFERIDDIRDHRPPVDQDQRFFAKIRAGYPPHLP